GASGSCSCPGSPTGARATSGRPATDEPASEHALLVELHGLRADDVRLDRREHLAAAADPVNVPFPHVAALLRLHADRVRVGLLAGLVSPQRDAGDRSAALKLRARPWRRLELLVLALLQAVERALPPAFLRLVVAGDRTHRSRRRDLRVERLGREAHRLRRVLV